MEARTIVVADDEADTVRLVRRIFEEKGCLVFSALEGRTAIELILTVKPDLVVLDVRMPIVQGYDVCRYIKNRGPSKKTKVLFLSGFSQEADIKWAESAGADDYLVKPFFKEDLLGKADRLLDGCLENIARELETD